jgi:hypothetical protein
VFSEYSRRAIQENGAIKKFEELYFLQEAGISARFQCCLHSTTDSTQSFLIERTHRASMPPSYGQSP